MPTTVEFRTATGVSYALYTEAPPPCRPATFPEIVTFCRSVSPVGPAIETPPPSRRTARLPESVLSLIVTALAFAP